MIESIISSISGFALNVIRQSGYWGVFILSALESAAIPIPSEVVVPFSGFLAVTGRFNLWAVILVATFANLVGSIVLYWIGASGGRLLLEKYGRYVLIRKHDLELGDRWFQKYGVWAVFWGRMLPVVRTFISLPAGITRMNFKKFCLFTTMGALPWNAALAYVGYNAGVHWNVLHEYLRSFDIIIAGVILAGVLFYLSRKLKRRREIL